MIQNEGILLTAFILENLEGSAVLDLAQILATSMTSNKAGILTHRPEVKSGCWAAAAGEWIIVNVNLCIQMSLFRRWLYEPQKEKAPPTDLCSHCFPRILSIYREESDHFWIALNSSKILACPKCLSLFWYIVSINSWWQFFPNKFSPINAYCAPRSLFGIVNASETLCLSLKEISCNSGLPITKQKKNGKSSSSLFIFKGLSASLFLL